MKENKVFAFEVSVINTDWKCFVRLKAGITANYKTRGPIFLLPRCGVAALEARILPHSLSTTQSIAECRKCDVGSV